MPKGLELVSRVGEPVGDTEGLVQFCSECSAGGSPLGVPIRGLDSHRDCASDGGAVWWARVVGRSADDADDSTTDAQAESPEQPALAAEAWPPHRWVRLPEGALSRLVERETDLLEMQSLLRRSHDSERDRYFARLIGGQLAVVDTALELVASLKEQTTDVEGCAGEAPRGRGTHGWVDQGRLIVDITADQFDDVDSPVIVTFDRSWYDRRFPETARHRIGGPQLLGAAAEAWQTADYRLLRDRLAQR